MSAIKTRLAATALATTVLLTVATVAGIAPAGAAPPWGAVSYGPSLTSLTPQTSAGDMGSGLGGPAGQVSAPGASAHAAAMLIPGEMATADRVPPPGAVAAQNREPDAWIPVIGEPDTPTLTSALVIPFRHLWDRSHKRPAKLNSAGHLAVGVRNRR
jgi:hypothetical protein